jgi:hypothetical protein
MEQKHYVGERVGAIVETQQHSRTGYRQSVITDIFETNQIHTNETKTKGFACAWENIKDVGRYDDTRTDCDCGSRAEIKNKSNQKDEDTRFVKL